MNRNWKAWIKTNQHLILGKRLIGFNFLRVTTIHLDNLLLEFSHPTDVLSIEATVHIEKAPIVNRQFQLPGLFAATIEEDVTALETNL